MTYWIVDLNFRAKKNVSDSQLRMHWSIHTIDKAQVS